MKAKKKPSKTEVLSGNVHSVVYFARDLRAVAAWYSEVLGQEPYRNDRDFVGFAIGRTSLCFHRSDRKSGAPTGSQVSYWNVSSLSKTSRHFIKHSAVWHRRPIRISEGGRVCQLKDPFGNIIGLAEE